MIELHQIAAALYLAAGIGSLLGVVLPAERMSRGGAWGLGLAALVHAAAFATLHRLDPPPPLTDVAVVISLSAWMAVVFLLLFMWRVRLPGLAAAIGPVAFLAVFVAALLLPHEPASASAAQGAWPHAHVLLAAAGLALLGLAGLAGAIYLVEHRRLKSKRMPPRRLQLPSLEALDRVNAVALALGFPLLTLGVLTGVAWQRAELGRAFAVGSHETWTVLAWVLYAGLVASRFLGGQGARQAAASAVAGFAFLLFAVVGIGLLP
ncbi:MAG: cytochrome c biogenesis protein CcsA [Myxococcota bacterium]|nr:cytochrome c biogenesis protein CcsA [Myxococcales bacterium]